MPNFRSGKGLVGGLVIVAVGVIFLLDQQHIVSAGQVFRYFWPAFIILFGLEDLLGGYNERKRVWGALLVAGGTLLLLNQLGYLHIPFSLFWPLVLIGLGVWILLHNYGVMGGPVWHHQPWNFGHRGPMGPGGPFGPRGPFGPSGPLGPNGPIEATGTSGTSGTSGPVASEGTTPQTPPAEGATEATNQQPPYQTAPGFAGGAAPQDPREWLRWHKHEAHRQRRALRHGWVSQDQPDAPPPGFDPKDAQFTYSSVFSHVERHITATNFKSGSLSAIFGGFEIDLTHAEIEGDEAVIYAEAFFGGGEIRIPETWQVVIEASALFGAFMDETRQRAPEAGAPAKRLIIRGTAVFGGVSIEN